LTAKKEEEKEKEEEEMPTTLDGYFISNKKISKG
jgi:hypothetical protein